MPGTHGSTRTDMAKGHQSWGQRKRRMAGIRGENQGENNIKGLRIKMCEMERKIVPNSPFRGAIPAKRPKRTRKKLNLLSKFFLVSADGKSVASLRGG